MRAIQPLEQEERLALACTVTDEFHALIDVPEVVVVRHLRLRKGRAQHGVTRSARAWPAAGRTGAQNPAGKGREIMTTSGRPGRRIRLVIRSDGDLCSTSRDPKWGDEARQLIEQHLGPPAQESPDGLEAVYFCPLSGQQWLSDHPNRAEQNPGLMRIRIVHERPPWWTPPPNVSRKYNAGTCEVICYECGDDSGLGYRDVSIQLQRIRAPYSSAAGEDAYEEHVRYHQQ
jgi:hypothetical protein